MTLILKEDTAEGVSPCQTMMDGMGGGATWTYVVQDDLNPTLPSNAAAVQFLVLTILGYTEYQGNGFGGLIRHTPLAHPLFPWLYAESITNLNGNGQYTLTAQSVNYENPNTSLILSQWASWPTWRCQIRFTARPYPVLPDVNIPLDSGLTWYDDTSRDATVAQQAINWRRVAEWTRYTSYEFLPMDNWITQQFGSMKFSSTDANNAKTFPNQTRMFIPDQILRLKWWQVPLRYLTSSNSYITQYKGRINQFAWGGPVGGNIFAKGSLLYLSFKPTIYTPPLQQSVNVFNSATYERMCDIEFDFLWTTRTGTALPANPTNQNYIVGGHNLLPYPVNRSFYYSVSNDAQQVPSWISFPVELLFKDPDTP